ncbi:hypothetical protein SAMN04488057_106177 [Cyclobacterium lianum]|uniref:Glycosyl-4,4'-diaponeurosporenoate acyltransferase n=1 Tax=Cyclobacterium lianum TaxID=388280 RepID=A0A1M7NYU5_9BACT|nr:hypothetical protein [Cyclobacterium lianum]SHN09247.1 hypothetical protein SAMN04488057_106177 [Cyclobacterium lianum]
MEKKRIRKYATLGLTWLFVLAGIIAVGIWQGLHTFVFAWVLNFLLMTGVLAFTETFQPKLNMTWFDSKKWEADGKIYKRFGVDLFRKLLVWVKWEKLTKAANPIKKDRETLTKLAYKTRQSEFGHAIIFIIVLIFGIVVAFSYGFRQSVWLLLLNILLNLYPIALQRYNRPRLRGILSN